MAHSTTKQQRTKPEKPRPDFPLFPHATGRWAKKVRGKLHYFGPWEDPKGALENWLADKDDLLAGRVPRRKDENALTLGAVVNRYLVAKRDDVEAGELTSRTHQDQFFACERILKHFGVHRLMSDVRQEDFAGYRKSLVNRGYAPATVNADIARCRALFNWAYEVELIDRPVRFGPQFKILSKKANRRKNSTALPKMFEPDEIKRLLESANTQLKAMILLGINCGFGNTDCSSLPKSALDLKGGWVDFPRPKTGIIRRAALWSETQAALREAIKARPEPMIPEHGGLVFLTAYGNPWVRMVPSRAKGKEARCQDAVANMFKELDRRTKVHRSGRGFYSLRRTFRTIADEVGDWPAVNLAMGHSDPTMGGVYRQRIADSRLKAVTDHVRAWLFSAEPKST